MTCSSDELQDAQFQFALLDQIPLGNCVLRADYAVLFWNSCLEEWTKIPRQDILGRSIARFFHTLVNRPMSTDSSKFFKAECRLSSQRNSTST